MTTDALTRASLRSVLIVDDHPLVVDGLSFALRHKLPGTQVSHAGSLSDALAWLDQHRTPDLILLDLNLPDADGLNALRSLLDRGEDLHVVVLSAQDDRNSAERVLSAGAHGFISKSTDSQKILDEIAAALDHPLLSDTSCPQASTECAHPPRLTPRQQEVLALLALGYPNKRICQQLGLTEDTVKTHLKALYQALNVHNRTECVAVAARLQLLPPFTLTGTAP
ncbi:MAG: DNA-binding response regulator [Gammaproteobacteria bacterium]|nr:MAG: DNA-binding response regulator [Gammaproteobacteria bacterium]